MTARRWKYLRKSSRRTLQASGWIRLGGGFAIRRCAVIDMSDTGARLAVTAQDHVPRAFSFTLDRMREGRAAVVKWRNGTEVGVEFVGDLGCRP
jgi:hypothetical protein